MGYSAVDAVSHTNKNIDGIDDKIVDLLLQRFELSIKVGVIKKKTNSCILDGSREEEIIERLSKTLKKYKINEKTSNFPVKNNFNIVPIKTTNHMTPIKIYAVLGSR